MTIPTSNTEIINNLIVILENMKDNNETDNHDNIKKILSKAITASMTGNDLGVKKQKKSNPYIDFIKDTMPKLQDTPKGCKLKVIREMWIIQKAFNALN
jgi:hypothetical protein